MSWPGWLTYSRRFTHITGHPSATGLTQDRESLPAKDRRSTAVPRNQLNEQLMSSRMQWSAMSDGHQRIPFIYVAFDIQYRQKIIIQCSKWSKGCVWLISIECLRRI